jgi:flagellar assembly factor FliW
MRKNKEPKMRVETKYDDVIEVEDSEVITFETGIPGFESEKEFVLLPIEDTVFSLLQSLSKKELAFITVNPFFFYPRYDINLPQQVIEQLAIKSPENVTVQSIVTATEPFNKSTMNLQAPVIINVETKKAKQIVLNDNRFNIRHPLTGQEA